MRPNHFRLRITIDTPVVRKTSVCEDVPPSETVRELIGRLQRHLGILTPQPGWRLTYQGTGLDPELRLNSCLPSTGGWIELVLTVADSTPRPEADVESRRGGVDEGNDIFETDFDIPALDDDSASEAIELDDADTDLEEMSDVDLALEVDDLSADDESASEVMLLDDDDMSVSRALEGVSAEDE